uniref:Uncharacterized protein n=1 Tax=Triticum urartu TaxID=4572 RepID=A0A8R7PAB2_TRIUA
MHSSISRLVLCGSIPWSMPPSIYGCSSLVTDLQVNPSSPPPLCSPSFPELGTRLYGDMLVVHRLENKILLFLVLFLIQPKVSFTLCTGFFCGCLAFCPFLVGRHLFFCAWNVDVFVLLCMDKSIWGLA